MEKKSMQIFVPVELHAQFKALAAIKGMSMNELIVKAIQKEVDLLADEMRVG